MTKKKDIIKLSLLTIRIQEAQVVCSVHPCQDVVYLNGDYYQYALSADTEDSLCSIPTTCVGYPRHDSDMNQVLMYVLGEVTEEHVKKCHGALDDALAGKLSDIQEQQRVLTEKLSAWRDAASSLLYAFTHHPQGT